MKKWMPWKINQKEMMKSVFGSVQPKTRYRLRAERTIPDGRVSVICSRSTTKRPYGFAHEAGLNPYEYLDGPVCDVCPGDVREYV